MKCTKFYCIYNCSGYVHFVRLGDLNKGDDIAQNIKPNDLVINERIVHANYVKAKRGFDIALLKLERNVDFSYSVRPACLAEHNEQRTELVVATGWGAIEYDGSTSNALMKVNLELFSHDECQRTMPKYPILETQICAGSHSAIKDTCQVSSKSYFN